MADQPPLTALRREIFDLIRASERPLKAYELLALLSAKRGRVAPPTVYRVLDYLTKCGLIHRIECLNAFSACPGNRHACEHAFLICRQCGSVLEVAAARAVQALRVVCASTGFEAKSFTQEVRGLCSACRASDVSEERPIGHAPAQTQ